MTMCLFSFELLRNGLIVFKVVQKGENSNLTYKNELNCLDFPKTFTATDFNIFFTICKYAKKHRNIETIEIPFDDLKIYFGSNIKNYNRFYNDVCNFVDKVAGSKGAVSILQEKANDYYGRFTFFKKIIAMKNKKVIRFKLNSYAHNLLFDTDRNFMCFDLYEFCKIVGKHPKSLFRILKEFENIKPNSEGVKVILLSKNQFIQRMCIDDNYTTSNIEREIIKPAVKELNNKNFKSISYEKEIAKNKYKAITGYRFMFVPFEKGERASIN